MLSEARQYQKLWSLWDMHRYYEPMFLTILLYMQRPQLDWVSGTIDDDALKQRLLQSGNDLKKEAARCNLAVVEGLADKITRYASSPCDAKAMITIATDVVGDIQRELLRHYYLRIPAEDRAYFEKVLLSDVAMQAFPSTFKDIRAAGRCFALEEWTACVLHCMRALEVPIAALVRALNFTPSNPNWETVLNECDREIKKIGPNLGADWKEWQGFYSEAALNFRYFKNAWRNHAMHGRESYDRNDALEILNHVLGFMDHLAKKLSEATA